MDRLTKERDRLQKIQAEMSADLEKLLNNRQEMALVKRLLKAAVKESKDAVPGKSKETVEIKGVGDHLDDQSALPQKERTSQSGKGDGPPSRTDGPGGFLNDIFPDESENRPQPTVFTRPRTLLQEPS